MRGSLVFPRWNRKVNSPKWSRIIRWTFFFKFTIKMPPPDPPRPQNRNFPDLLGFLFGVPSYIRLPRWVVCMRVGACGWGGVQHRGQISGLPEGCPVYGKLAYVTFKFSGEVVLLAQGFAWSANQRKIIGQLLGHLFVFFGLFHLKIYWKGISKREVVWFCFTGHRSNPNLTDWSPENLDVHDILIFATSRNPYLWICIYQIIWEIQEYPYSFLENMTYMRMFIFENVESWKLGILKPWNLGILKLRNFETLKLWNFATLKLWNFGALEFWNLGILESGNFKLNSWKVPNT